MTTKVLIVDPEIGFAVPIKRALELSGDYRVNVFASGKAASEALQRERHDVAILDFNVADVPLIDLIGLLRRVQPELFILVSPSTDQHMVQVPSLDVQGTITKPYMARQLVAVIREAVNASDQLASSQPVEEAAALSDAPPFDLAANEPAIEPDDTFVRMIALFSGEGSKNQSDQPAQITIEEPEIPEGATIRDLVQGNTPPHPAEPIEPEPVSDPSMDTPRLAIMALEAAEDDTISLRQITPPNLTQNIDGEVDDTAAALSSWLQQIVAAEQSGQPTLETGYDYQNVMVQPAETPPPVESASPERRADSEIAEELFGGLLPEKFEDTAATRRDATKPLDNLMGKLIDEANPPVHTGPKRKTALLDRLIDHMQADRVEARNRAETPSEPEPTAQPESQVQERAQQREPEPQEHDAHAEYAAMFEPEATSEPAPTAQAEIAPEAQETAEPTPAESQQEEDLQLEDIQAAAEEAPAAEAPVSYAESDEAVSEPESEPEPELQAAEEESPVATLALQLTQLTVGTTAEATLVTRGNQVIASAGQIPQRTLSTVLETISGAWADDTEHSNALVRYLHVTGTGDYLLYSTPTADGMALSMLFPAETPLKVIRRHAKELIAALNTVPPAPVSEVQEIIPEPATTLLSRPTDLRPPEGLRDAVATQERPAVDEAADEQTAPPRAEGPYTGYSFAWLPRVDVLPADIAGVLLDWIHAIAREHQWDLEGVEIQPGYVTVQVSIPANETPTTTVETLMHETSERAADYILWADAYYIVTPDRAITQQEIASFVEYHRDAQSIQ